MTNRTRWTFCLSLVVCVIFVSAAVAGETRTIQAGETVSEILGTNDQQKIDIFIEMNREAGGDEIQNAGDLIIAGNQIYVPSESELNGIAWEMNENGATVTEAVNGGYSEDNPEFIGPPRPPEDPEDNDVPQPGDDDFVGPVQPDEEETDGLLVEGPARDQLDLLEEDAPSEVVVQNVDNHVTLPGGDFDIKKSFENNAPNLLESKELCRAPDYTVVSANSPEVSSNASWWAMFLELWK